MSNWWTPGGGFDEFEDIELVKGEDVMIVSYDKGFQNFKNNEQHGVFCQCGRCIFIDESDLTPPETRIKCPICGFEIKYYTRNDVNSSEELDEFEKESYNKALKDLLDRIDLMFLYKDTKGIFHSASYANLNRKSIHAVAEQLMK